jgi:DNA-binding HxlR family transcriptional regulator
MEDFDVGPSDRSVWFEEGYTEDLREFFGESGGIELISCLRGGPKRFEELREQIDYSKSIVNKRLTEAQGLYLVKMSQQSRGDTVYRVHSLTPMGETISTRMQELGLSQTHQRLWTIRLEFEQYKEEFDDWVGDPDGLENRIEEYTEMLDHEE